MGDPLWESGLGWGFARTARRSFFHCPSGIPSCFPKGTIHKSRPGCRRPIPLGKDACFQLPHSLPPVLLRVRLSSGRSHTLASNRSLAPVQKCPGAFEDGSPMFVDKTIVKKLIRNRFWARLVYGKGGWRSRKKTTKYKGIMGGRLGKR